MVTTIGKYLLIVVSISLGFAARPFFTDDAGTVATGSHELEAGFDYWSDNMTVSLGFKHGLTDRMDMGIGFGYTIEPDAESGFTNIELGIKYALISDFLSASAVVNPGDPAYAFTGILSRSLGSFVINLNTGYEVNMLPDDNGTLCYALGVLYEANQFTFGLEACGNEDDLDSWLIGGNAGLITGLNLDLGLSGTFEDIENSLLLTAGLHYEF